MTRSTPAKRPPVASGTDKAATKPAAGKRTDGLRTGSKLALMLDLALRPEGVTEPELLAALGWKSCRVTLRRACDRAGAELTITKVRPRGMTHSHQRLTERDVALFKARIP